MKKIFHFLSSYLRNPTEHGVDYRMGQLVVVDPGKSLAMGDEQGGDAVDASPESLADHFGIVAAEFPRCYTIEDTTAKKIEGLHSGRIRLA